ncbi:hypothetical protein [Haloferula sargassicola]|uniref:Uncharacterized protein n=1 Tax=Haloferula sargassicola TaxID=490096 RepID=A0ABP9UUW9_9BACT
MIAAIFDILLNQTFLLDAAGLVGLGLVAMGAIRLAERYHSINAPLMIWGAVALILGRIGILAFSQIAGTQAVYTIPKWAFWSLVNVPVGLLTLGVGLIVAGLWLHERDVDAKFVEATA